ncbi:ankyrin repeat and SAM domain-containing protein 3-like [Corticium candelabrum]|uniref:ankyrin repeat and SAM domain-containing protein 3-like n=1 Tax=Corticium candelabrum TaxID=121492 RepID=UPI002E26B920|nr:ankyrin repeat and SAM domain-containing protein 3-like [Corticium candelabrum]
MSFDSSASSGDNSSDVDVSAPRDVIYDDTSNSQPRHALDLHTACAIGHFDCVMRLIASRSRSLDINEKNRGGWTPLMYASYVGHDKIVDLLLEKSADVNVAACDGGTALMWAASCGNEAVAYFLLLHGSEINKKDNEGHTALFHATRQGHQNVVKLLLEQGADVEAGEPDSGLTPLMEAAKEGHELIVNTLLLFNADVSKVSQAGDTARSLALQHGHMMVVSLMDSFFQRGHRGSLRSEADLDDNDSSGDEGKYQLNSPQFDDCLGLRRRASTQDVDIRAGPAALNQLVRRQDSETSSFRRLSARQSISSAVSSSSHAVTREYFNYPIPPTERSHQNFEDLASSGGSSYNSSAESASAHSSDSEASQVNQTLTQTGLEDYEEDDRQTHSFPARDKSFSRKHELKKQREVAHHRNSKRLFSASPEFVDEWTQQRQQQGQVMVEAGVNDLGSFLEEIGVEKYVELFEENDIDLRTLLTLTDDDLKEIGLKLFGPRRKVTAAIARWHAQMKQFSSELEQAYADKLEVEMQELEIKYQQATAEVKQLKSQVAQEQNLRSIAESVLVDERAMKQTLVENYSKACTLCKQAMELVHSSGDEGTVNGPRNSSHSVQSDDNMKDTLTDRLQQLQDILSSSTQ